MQNKYLVGIVLLGLVFRLINLDQSLWLDEATSILVARDFSVSQILTKFSPGDFHPPLYYLVLHFWIYLFGSSEIGARSLSVFLGLLGIILIYMIGSKLFSKNVGLVAALLLSIAPLHIYYSQEARMYVPASTIALAVVWFFLRVVEGPRNLLFWVLFSLSSILLIYTDYPLLFLFPFLGVYLIAFQRKMLAENIKKWSVLVLALVLSFGIWSQTFYSQFLVSMAVKTDVPGWWMVLGGVNAKQLALVPTKFMVGRISSYDKEIYALGVGIAALVFLIPLKNSLLNWKNTKFTWLWLIVPLLLAALVGLKLSIYSYFRFLFVLPAFYLLVAAGGSFCRNNNLKKLLLVGVIAVNLTSTSIYLFNPRFHREDWKSAVSWIENNSQDSTTAIFVANSQRDPYRYYSQTVPSYGPEGVNGGYQFIWLVRFSQPIFDPKDKLRHDIENAGYKKIEEKDFNGVVIWKYEKSNSLAYANRY